VLLRAVPQPVGSLAFAPDGRTLAWTGEPESLGLIDARTGQERGALSWRPPERPWYAWQPNERVTFRPGGSAAFSPDGRFVAALGQHQFGSSETGRHPSVLVWEVESGREYCRLPGVVGAGFGPDGSAWTVRHPGESGDAAARLDRWRPEDLPDELPGPVAAAARAGPPRSLLRSQVLPGVKLGPVGLPLPLVALAVLLGLQGLTRTLVRDEPGADDLFRVAVAVLPGLLLVLIGFYYLLTLFDDPGWSWLSLLAGSWWFLSIVFGLQFLQEEWRGRQPTEVPEEATAWAKAALAFWTALVMVASAVLVGLFIWQVYTVGFFWVLLGLLAFPALFAALGIVWLLGRRRRRAEGRAEPS
jgi:hypothetical protein